MKSCLTLLGLATFVAACQQADGEVGSGPTEAFSAIAQDEIIFLTGTEPFWGGEIENETALYSTPENQDGTQFPVERFAGNNGLAFTGQMDAARFDLMITPGECSDGMSDRTYPFVATLQLDDEQRNGCAWTNNSPFSGPANP